MNIKVTIAYNGSNYHGFERQKNAVGVQNVIEDALLKLTGEKTDIIGCSRTDTGVHAREFIFNFHTETELKINRIVTGLNHFLPSDIAAKSAETVPDDFHARYSCTGKEYEYLIFCSKNRNPFYENLAFRYSVPIDENLLQKELAVIVGKHDFRSFCGQNGIRENTVREIYAADIKRVGDIITITISGDGFLYNMIRIIVGTLLEINEGKREPGAMLHILNALDRSAAGRTAPPEGLYLNRVYYEK
ncbi:MAG: tRNA pseudouridine(38-40) synthase TruA [Ruminococcus sp.]|jgi:tRNA pseudouridine38-40 synthase|nr:tRNA pseudouridine(38-40) synthase TruA [Ruminococcus sp.]